VSTSSGQARHADDRFGCARDVDLADLGDLVERLTKIARANGVATMSVLPARSRSTSR
jgi:hypothetical protein